MNIYHSTKAMPYVYICIHKTTGEFYIGYRCKNVKLNLPSTEDLPKYKTSSTVVRQRFDEFRWEIVAEFFDATAAYDFEQELIFNSWNDPLLLNRICHYGKRRWRYDLRSSQRRTSADFTSEWKEKISLAKTGQCQGSNNPMYGKTHSKESKAKISATRKSKASDPTWNIRPPCSVEKASKIKVANTGKKWIHNKLTKERKYIDPSLVTNFLSLGWELGLGKKRTPY